MLWFNINLLTHDLLPTFKWRLASLPVKERNYYVVATLAFYKEEL